MDITQVKRLTPQPRFRLYNRYGNFVEYKAYTSGTGLFCVACGRECKGSIAALGRADNAYDLCVSAVAQGWRLTKHDSYCEYCKYRLVRCGVRNLALLVGTAIGRFFVFANRFI